MKYGETVIQKTDLIVHFKQRLRLMSKDGEDLTDDDTLHDFMIDMFEIFLEKNDLSWQDLNTLVVGNYFIQNEAWTPLDYEVVVIEEVFKEIK